MFSLINSADDVTLPAFAAERRAAVPEMDMGWDHPWVGLGWVGSHFPAHVMG